MADCVFCAIVAGDSPAHVIYEDEHTVAFLDIAPFTRGHTLVVPRAHHDDLWDVELQMWTQVSRSVHVVAARLRDHLQPEGMNLLQATRSVAFQTVFHLHVHVIPRWGDDGVSIPSWPKHRADEAELERLAAELR